MFLRRFTLLCRPGATAPTSTWTVSLSTRPSAGHSVVRLTGGQLGTCAEPQCRRMIQLLPVPHFWETTASPLADTKRVSTGSLCLIQTHGSDDGGDGRRRLPTLPILRFVTFRRGWASTIFGRSHARAAHCSRMSLSAWAGTSSSRAVVAAVGLALAGVTQPGP